MRSGKCSGLAVCWLYAYFLAQWSSLVEGDKPGRKASPQANCRILLAPCAGAGVGRCLLNAKEQQHMVLADL